MSFVILTLCSFLPASFRVVPVVPYMLTLCSVVPYWNPCWNQGRGAMERALERAMHYPRKKKLRTTGKVVHALHVVVGTEKGGAV